LYLFPRQLVTTDEQCHQDEDARFMNMQVLLEKSSIFTEVLKDQMDRTREKHAAVAAAATQKRPAKAKPKQHARHSRRRASGRGKRTRVDSDDDEGGSENEEEEQEPPKRVKVLVADAKPAFVQPALVTGATLKDYQLEGVAWMVSLWENGISGILGESSSRRQFFHRGLLC
jgi:ATP-dependent DNA helicase